MKKLQNTHQYDDIIHRPRPVSKKHAPMSCYDRAAQFSPFAALTGYDDVIEEAGRLTDSAALLDEGGMALLDEKLQQIQAHITRMPQITVTYFREDDRKSGGSYLSLTARVKKIDACQHVLWMADGTAIPITSIYELELKE